MINLCPCGRLREGCDYHDPKLQPGYAVVPEVPGWDVSGTAFIPGVTNFTSENMLDALTEFEVMDYSAVILYVHPALRSRLNKCSLLDFNAKGQASLAGIRIEQDPLMLQTRGIYTSRFVAADDTIGLLTTREH